MTLFLTHCLPGCVSAFYNQKFAMLYHTSRLSAGAVSLVGLLCACTMTWAQSTEEVKPLTSVYLIKDATVTVSPGVVIDNCDVLIDDGIIRAVGPDLTDDPRAQVIDADSMYVYAGLIAGLSHVGVPKPKAKGSQRPSASTFGPTSDKSPHERAGTEPHLQAREKIIPTDKSIEAMRQLGFTAAHVVPRGRMMPGSGALVILHGKTSDDMVLMEPVSVHSQFVGSGTRDFPRTTIGVMAKFKEYYRQAELFAKHQQRFQADAKGLRRPKQDRGIEAMLPVVDGSLPVFFRTEKALDVQKALTLQKELQFDLALCEVKQGTPIKHKIKKAGFPVLLSLELPKEEKAKSSKDKKKAASADSTSADNPEIKALKERKKASQLAYEGQAAAFAELGIDFAFSMIDFKSKDFRKNLRRIIQAGLSEDQALAALTTHPAQMLGAHHLMGTVETGKMGNLVITNLPLFSEKVQTAYVFVDGIAKQYELKKDEKKDGDKAVTEDVAARVAGEWTYTVEVPGQSSTGTLTISHTNGVLEGSMTNSNYDDDIAVEALSYADGALQFSTELVIEGQTTLITYDLDIKGETFEGKASVGEYGDFRMEGSRTSIPKNN